MSTGRTVWIVFCLAWAGFWGVFSLVLVGVGGPLLGLPLALASVAAIALPVGKTQAERAVPVLPPPAGLDAAELETRQRLGGRSSVFDRRPRASDQGPK